jgi:hypothetical protein
LWWGIWQKLLLSHLLLGWQLVAIVEEGVLFSALLILTIEKRIEGFVVFRRVFGLKSA